jgi:DNA-binding transcriptional MerR regulator
MSNDTTWLTVAEAAQILRVTPRQVHRYAEHKQLVTRRAGRRVLFDAASVARLADELAVDVRPAPAQRNELMSPELARYLAEQARMLQQQGESTERIERQLQALREQAGQPIKLEVPRWLVALLIAFVALLLMALIVIIIRGG